VRQRAEHEEAGRHEEVDPREVVGVGDERHVVGGVRGGLQQRAREEGGRAHAEVPRAEQQGGGGRVALERAHGRDARRVARVALRLGDDTRDALGVGGVNEECGAEEP